MGEMIITHIQFRHESVVCTLANRIQSLPIVQIQMTMRNRHKHDYDYDYCSNPIESN